MLLWLNCELRRKAASIHAPPHHKRFFWLILKVQQLMFRCQINILISFKQSWSIFTGQTSENPPTHSGQLPTCRLHCWLHVGMLYISRNFVSIQTWTAWVLSAGQHIKSCGSICCLWGWILSLESFWWWHSHNKNKMICHC